MVITIPTLALLVLAIALPNYLAVRYAVFGGSPVAPVTEGGSVSLAPARGRARRSELFAKLTQRGYLWKALSPFVFAASVILSLGLGGVAGISLVVLAALNLVWGFLGWSGYVPGRR
ncbi:MAG TPA: hypothetical protein VNT75_22140 [Symbiobacteriaceae bacterium]|nr:hypothetical protein [Symbiobacteriaceae bacterium]